VLADRRRKKKSNDTSIAIFKHVEAGSLVAQLTCEPDFAAEQAKYS